MKMTVKDIFLSALLASVIGLVVALYFEKKEKKSIGEDVEVVSIDTLVSEDLPEVGFDSVLAAQYGADKYGMKSYVIAFLTAGPHRSQSPEEAEALQKSHLDNISRMAEEGKLVLAGPFFDDGELRGLYIFNTGDTAEARAWTETDPSIQKGRLEMDLRPWYGSAALVGVNEVHEKIAKENP